MESNIPINKPNLNEILCFVFFCDENKFFI